jgi:hypothetical protein
MRLALTFVEVAGLRSPCFTISQKHWKHPSSQSPRRYVTTELAFYTVAKGRLPIGFGQELPKNARKQPYLSSRGALTESSNRGDN